MRDDQYWLNARWETERAARDMWSEEVIGDQGTARGTARWPSLTNLRAAIRAALRRATLRPAP